MLNFKCTLCQAAFSFPSRAAAIEKGWVFAQVENKTRLKYFVICPSHDEKWIKMAMESTNK